MKTVAFERRAGSAGLGVLQVNLRKLLLSSAMFTGTMAFAAPSAFAACAPAAGGAGVPPSGTTVTCSGATTNQNGTNGYGTGAETGLNINVQSGATVTGTNRGIDVGTGNTVNVFGTVQGQSGYGIAVLGGSHVNNSGTVAGANSNLGISLYLSGNATATNLAGGIIGTNDNATGVFGGFGFASALTNYGTVRGYRGTQYVLNVDNYGTITGPNVDTGGSVGIGVDMRTQNSSLINRAGATVSGYWGVVVVQGSSIFNAGTIDGQGGFGILMQSATLTIAPTSVINGTVGDFNGVVTGPDTNTLQLGGSGNGTFDVSLIGPAAQYRTFNTFNKVDSSTWTLTGSGTQTWNVNAGTLLVNGTIGGAVVNSGGTLGGTGTAGNTTIASGGTLSPGNSIGVLNINGNLVLGAGAIYLVEVSPSAADRTNITGTAQLGGEARLVFGPGSYSANSYTILSAAGGRTGTFNTMTTTGLPATLSASLSYTATDVLLVTLTSQIGPTLPGLIGLTPNQRAVAAAQDTAFNSGLPNITALYDLSLAQMPAALDQLSGEVHPTTAGVLADESLYARSAILGRLRQAAYGGNTQMASLTMGGPQAFAPDEELNTALAYGKSPIVTKAPIAARLEYDVTFWAQGFGAKGRFDGDGNATNVRRDLAGFFSGIDTRVGGNGRLGIAAGYTGSRNNLDGRGSSNVETGHIAGYGGWGFGAFNLRAGGDFAWHQIDTSRNIVFPGFFDTATASYKGRTGQIFGEAGYGVAFNNVAVEPFAGGAWVHLNTDGFTERALLAGLNGAANSFEVGYSNVGIRAASMIPLANDMMLVPRASMAWQHAFNDVTPDGRLAFIAAPVPFVIAGTPIARDSILGEAGLDLAFGRSATIGVSYTGQLARNVQDHAAKGKFSWKF